MAKLIVLSMITLDGVMQAPGGPEEDPRGGFTYGGWTVPYVDESIGEVMGQQVSGSSEFLLGRKTFEIFASYWPQHAEVWPGINQATKYVASNTLPSHPWEKSVFLTSDVLVDEIKKLKQQNGPDLHVYGSGNLIQTLMRHDLIDAFWLRIFPITLGTGKRLFADGTIPAAFTMSDSQVSPNGVIVANYERAGDVETGSF